MRHTSEDLSHSCRTIALVATRKRSAPCSAPPTWVLRAGICRGIARKSIAFVVALPIYWQMTVICRRIHSICLWPVPPPGPVTSPHVSVAFFSGCDVGG